MLGKLVKAVKSVVVGNNRDSHNNMGLQPTQQNPMYHQPYNPYNYQPQHHDPYNNPYHQPYYDPEIERQIRNIQEYARQQLGTVHNEIINNRSYNDIVGGIRQLRDQQQQEAIANGISPEYYQKLNEAYNSAFNKNNNQG